MQACKSLLTALALVGSIASSLPAAESCQITITAGEVERRQCPVCVPMELPAEMAEVTLATLVGPDGQELVGQVTAPGLLDSREAAAEGMVLRELHFILPRLAAGDSIRYKASPATEAEGPQFSWHDTPGEYGELRDGDQPVLRYMYRALDESSPAAREQTYKVFHHLFDPTGTQRVTKGPGGLYTHHRGLFYGFNRVTYGKDGRQADVWHCKGKAYQSHEEHVASAAGPVLGRHQVRIGWHGQDGEVFAEEWRELCVYRVPDGHLVEFASRLRSAGESIRLDGDPQHAGFHFRADNEVAASTKGQTYYLRPDGKGGTGETRNWPDQSDHVNLPWNAMSFVLGDDRFTAAYLDLPSNPKEARFSERDYGRFGSYFEYDLSPTDELVLDYRVWLQEGEMTAEQVAALSSQFAHPVGATVE